MGFPPNFDAALSYAAALHRDQRRKGSDIPYIAHLLSVCAIVIENGGSEAQAIGALLHDAAEDQGGEPRLRQIETTFGPEVAAIVSDCTDAWTEPKPEWRQRKDEYLAHLPSKPATSLLVSLADKVHNAEAIAADYRLIGDAVWDRFTGGRDGTAWYYRTLADLYRTSKVPQPLVDRLAAAVALFAPEPASP